MESKALALGKQVCAAAKNSQSTSSVGHTQIKAIVTFLCFCTIVCRINILGDSRPLAWFCQTKVWTPFF
jgi:hypothetical protein